MNIYTPHGFDRILQKYKDGGVRKEQWLAYCDQYLDRLMVYHKKALKRIKVQSTSKFRFTVEEYDAFWKNYSIGAMRKHVWQDYTMQYIMALMDKHKDLMYQLKVK